MYSKTLINLIDYAIFPAILIVSAKILGIVFLTRYFDASYTIDGVRLVFDNVENFIAINSYSSLFMFCAVLGGLIWVLIKAHVFHDTHVTPALSAKLVNLDMNDIVDTTRTIYTQAFIWLSFAWLTTIVFGVQSIFGLSYWWVFWLCLILSIIATSLIAIDFEREVNKDLATTEENVKPESIITLREIRKELFD